MARRLGFAVGLLLGCACARPAPSAAPQSPAAVAPPVEPALFSASWDQVIVRAVPGPEAGVALAALARELGGPAAPGRFVRLPAGRTELLVLALDERDLRVPGAPAGEARTVYVGAFLRDTVAQRTVFLHLLDPLTTSQLLLDRLASQRLLASPSPTAGVVRRQLVLGGEPMAEQADDARLALDVEAHGGGTTVLLSLLAPGSAKDGTLAAEVPEVPEGLALADAGLDVRFRARPEAKLRLLERSAGTTYSADAARLSVMVKSAEPRVQALFSDAGTRWREVIFLRRTVRFSLPVLDAR